MKYFFTYSFVLIASLSYSQQKNNLIGIIRDSSNNEPLPYATIINLYTNKTTIANKQGVFSVPVKADQLISFASMGYNFDTLRVTGKLLSKDTLIILLSPLTHKLLDITVYASKKYNAYQLDSMERRKDFFRTMTEHTQPVFSNANSGPGIGFNLDHFYSREKKKRKSISLFDEIENEQYINYRFNPEEISKYASFTTDSLLLFMQQYRPSYNWLRKHTNEEDILYYVNDKLKIFFKRKEKN